MTDQWETGYPPDTTARDALVVGIDPSAKKIAIVAHHPVLFATTAQSYVLYKDKDKQTPEALGRAVEAMETFLEYVSKWTNGPKYAWVEDPLIGRGGVLTTMKQSLVQGVVRGMLARSGFMVYGVNVSTWKKDVVGHGRAEKSDVRRVVKVRWPKVEPLIGNDGDLADAAAICLYGQAVLDKSAAGLASLSS